MTALLKMIPIKVYITLAVLLVATIGGYWMIQQLKSIGRQELQIEKLEENIQIRNRIDAATRNAPVDRDGSIGVLNDFLNSRD